MEIIFQPKPTKTITVDSTQNSYCDDMMIIEDYIQMDQTSQPQRSPNPIPFFSNFNNVNNNFNENNFYLNENCNSNSCSESNSFAEGLPWFK